jgi:hypothetical protein
MTGALATAHRAATSATREIVHRAATSATREIVHRAATSATREIVHRAATQVTREIAHRAATRVTREIHRHAAMQKAQEHGGAHHQACAHFAQPVAHAQTKPKNNAQDNTSQLVQLASVVRAKQK